MPCSCFQHALPPFIALATLQLSQGGLARITSGLSKLSNCDHKNCLLYKVLIAKSWLTSALLIPIDIIWCCPPYFCCIQQLRLNSYHFHHQTSPIFSYITSFAIVRSKDIFTLSYSISNMLNVITNISNYITLRFTFFSLLIHFCFVHYVAHTLTMTADCTQLTILTWSFQTNHSFM